MLVMIDACWKNCIHGHFNRVKASPILNVLLQLLCAAKLYMPNISGPHCIAGEPLL
jgi:hypothetical protein